MIDPRIARELTERLAAEHAPLTDKDGKPEPRVGGFKKDESIPIQCRKCLRAWPCETRQLLNIIDDLLVQDG
jgi:Fe-S-cluster-containing hydrogenase component 2